MMKNIKPNAELVWKQLEDVLVPRLRLSVTERVIYFHLLRHSDLEGRRRMRFSISWLGRGVCLTEGPVRDSLRRLITRGILRLVQRSRAGHLIEVRLPEEIRAARWPLRPVTKEAADVLESRALRQAIHAREGGHCFYCLRRITRLVRCLDHVVPLARRGDTSSRNLVSSCMECNSQKGEKVAQDFLRWLYRERRLTAVELSDRLRALDDLASGKLRPHLPATAKGATK
jgi:5-methylcytosine-specific restriction endonuclease McrA